jgi:hypothetical protein
MDVKGIVYRTPVIILLLPFHAVWRSQSGVEDDGKYSRTETEIA